MDENSNGNLEFVKNLLLDPEIEYSKNDIEMLKEYFAEDISSVRQASYIEDLGSLLKILEDRDVYNESNVKALQDVADLLDNEKISEKISKYKPSPDLGENVYALQRLQEELQTKARITSSPSMHFQFNPNSSHRKTACCNGTSVRDNSFTTARNTPIGKDAEIANDKKEIIYNLISKEIGKKWRKFGRGLGIREGEMDYLENDYRYSSVTRVRKMLQMFEENGLTNPQGILFKICKSLEDCRRKDISREIQNLQW